MLALSIGSVAPAEYNHDGLLSGEAGPEVAAAVASASAWAPSLAAAQPAARKKSRASRSRVGFSPGFDIIDLSPKALRRDLAGMRRVGARRIRVDLSWARVESRQGSYDWRDTDRVFKAARARGLKILALLSYEPSWARRYDVDGRRQPVNPQAFARFASAAARRYGSMVDAWEIWNEPNLQRFWPSGPDPAAYAALVDAVAPVIKRHDPRSTVIAGALSPALDDANGSEVSPVSFLTGFYAASQQRNAVDAVSVHPYSYPALPSGRQNWNTFHRLSKVHQVMKSAGTGNQRIWLTEYGAPTGKHPRAVSAKRQGRMLAVGHRMAGAVKYLGPIFFYSYRDGANRPDELEANFGIVRKNGSRKASYYSLVRALRARN